MCQICETCEVVWLPTGASAVECSRRYRAAADKTRAQFETELSGPANAWPESISPVGKPAVGKYGHYEPSDRPNLKSVRPTRWNRPGQGTCNVTGCCVCAWHDPDYFRPDEGKSLPDSGCGHATAEAHETQLYLQRPDLAVLPAFVWMRFCLFYLMCAKLIVRQFELWTCGWTQHATCSLWYEVLLSKWILTGV